MKRWELVTTAVLMAVVGALVAEKAEPFLHRNRNRHELLELAQQVEIGMPESTARRLFVQPISGHLEYSRGSDILTASMPFEIGAKNWILRVDLRDRVVSGIRIRTADGVDDHPGDAPPDRVR